MSDANELLADDNAQTMTPHPDCPPVWILDQGDRQTVRQRIADLTALAYRGDNHLPGYTYKRLLEEMTEELDAVKDAGADLTAANERNEKGWHKANEKIAKLTAENARLTKRLRETCQILVEIVGADGPCSAEEAAERVKAEVAKLVGERDELQGSLGYYSDEARAECVDAYRGLKNENVNLTAAVEAKDREIERLRGIFKQVQFERDFVVRCNSYITGKVDEALGVDRFGKPVASAALDANTVGGEACKWCQGRTELAIASGPCPKCGHTTDKENNP